MIMLGLFLVSLFKYLLFFSFFYINKNKYIEPIKIRCVPHCIILKPNKIFLFLILIFKTIFFCNLTTGSQP